MRFLAWWATLSGWIRYPIAFLVIFGSTVGFFTLRLGYGTLWGLGWALGIILLLVGPSRSNKKGYHF